MNSAGTTTIPRAITYLPAVETFPILGHLLDGIYDPHRNVYYFTDSNQVRVFSLERKKWLAPIRIPSPRGSVGPQRLLAVALSPDGSKMAVSDYGAGAIYVIDLNHPGSIQSFIPSKEKSFNFPSYFRPTGLAVTNSGVVLFAISDTNGGGGGSYLYRLNTFTGGITPCDIDGTDGGFQDSPAGRVVMNAAGTRVYFDNQGAVGYIDPEAGSAVVPYRNAYLLGDEDYEFALASNGKIAFGDGFLFDADLNTTGMQALNWRESFDAEYVYGAAFSPDGLLFFQPGLHAIDVFDGRSGTLRARVALPLELSPNYRALIPDGKDKIMMAITGNTGNGIAVMDLTGVSEPGPLPYR